MDPIDRIPGVVRFGRCELLPRHRELRVDGDPVRLGARAFDLLLVLVEGSGKLVTKDEILNRVWPGVIVEENTLQVQVSALRKALGVDRGVLKTIYGRGYRFVAEMDTTSEAGRSRSVASDALTRSSTNLPAPASELIGRETELCQLLELAATHRLITLVGFGGIGKTRLALEAARELLPRFNEGVCHVDLAALSDAACVPDAVAQALGVNPHPLLSEDAAARFAANHRLVVLDNCEHVVHAAAEIAEALLSANAVARLIVTSREPLRAEGERVFRVPPLDVPPDTMEESGRLLKYGALKLLKARAGLADGLLSQPHVASASAAVCRSVNGNPLAIELAAARVSALGMEELARRVDEPLALLSGGRRTAQPRHQSMRASLDWSYERLTDSERALLPRLAVFATRFNLEAAIAIGKTSEMDASAVVDCLSNLVSKSLVDAHTEFDAQYSLLHMTRAYAWEKLAESGTLEDITRRHTQLAAVWKDGAAMQSAGPMPARSARWANAHNPRRRSNDVEAPPFRRAAA